MSQHLHAVKYDERFLEASWKWLQDAEIRHLTLTPPFTREQQRAWFESLSVRSNYLIWGIELDRTPIGAFGIKAIREKTGEYWGYIGAKDCWGRGIGRWMMQHTLTTAHDLGLERLELKVLKENERAIRLYRNFGFQERSSSIDDDLIIRMERIVS